MPQAFHLPCGTLPPSTTKRNAQFLRTVGNPELGRRFGEWSVSQAHAHETHQQFPDTVHRVTTLESGGLFETRQTLGGILRCQPLH